MSNPISGMAGRAPVTAAETAQETPQTVTGSSTRLLYGIATPELTSILERVMQLPLTAQAAVRAKNPDLQ